MFAVVDVRFLFCMELLLIVYCLLFLQIFIAFCIVASVSYVIVIL